MGLLNIFPHITGIGDSLLTGCHTVKDKYLDSPEYSWLRYICNRNGIKYTSLTRGGLTAQSWLDIYSYFIDHENCPCYFICLGNNDFGLDYIIGNIEDKRESNTFIGYYKEIINIILKHNPYAKIFCLSTYYHSKNTNKNGNTIQDFSHAIEDITNLYDNTYFIDFEKKSKYSMPDSGFDYLNHYDTLGYYLISEEIETFVHEIIEENIEDFKKIGLYNSFGTNYKNIKENF